MKQSRPLTTKEVAILEKDLALTSKQLRFQKRFLLGWVLLALIIASLILFRLETKTELFLLAGTVITYVAIGAWSFFEQTSKLKKARRNIEFAMENEALLIKVESKEYIELSEDDDEGIFYLFQLDDNIILSFGGQDFYPTKRFPSDSFEILIAYGPRMEIVLLKKYITGSKLRPVLKLSGKEKWDLMSKSNYPDPEKFTLVDGRLEDYKQLTA